MRRIHRSQESAVAKRGFRIIDSDIDPHAMDAFLALVGLRDASRRKILWDTCAALSGRSG
jgi:hypothetical protein